VSVVAVEYDAELPTVSLTGDEPELRNLRMLDVEKQATSEYVPAESGVENVAVEVVEVAVVSATPVASCVPLVQLVPLTKLTVPVGLLDAELTVAVIVIV
jgi:hypothetical protein